MHCKSSATSWHVFRKLHKSTTFQTNVPLGHKPFECNSINMCCHLAYVLFFFLFFFFFFQGEVSIYANHNSYECLPCAEGCDACKDASPCVAALNWPMRTIILALACAVIGLLPPAAWFTFRYQHVKVKHWKWIRLIYMDVYVSTEPLTIYENLYNEIHMRIIYHFGFPFFCTKVLRAASPALLRVIALGAFFIYCTVSCISSTSK